MKTGILRVAHVTLGLACAGCLAVPTGVDGVDVGNDGAETVDVPDAAVDTPDTADASDGAEPVDASDTADSPDSPDSIDPPDATEDPTDAPDAPDVAADPPVEVCTPRTCSDLGASCGPAMDGCGGTLDCGTCASPETCAGGGVPNVCGCTPTTCAAAGAACGRILDGCGSYVDCGSCPGGGTCGWSLPYSCGSAPYTYCYLSVLPGCYGAGDCGWVSNGCNDVVWCGTCWPGQTCGGGGVANQCGCRPRTCADAGAGCGLVSDGCGGTVDCGSCPTAETCGGGGVANVCGAGTCTPGSCSSTPSSCGLVGDGCGAALDCGGCGSPQACGGAWTPNVCGCAPPSCTELSSRCGRVSDGCGGTLDCGGCTQSGLLFIDCGAGTNEGFFGPDGVPDVRCTVAPGANSFSVSVAVSNMPTFNAFDVHVAYDTSLLTLDAIGIDTAGAVLPSPLEFSHCVDGSGMGCDIDDSWGIVHMAAASSSFTPDPASGILFNIQLTIRASGRTVLAIFNDAIADGRTGTAVAHATIDGGFAN